MACRARTELISTVVRPDEMAGLKANMRRAAEAGR